MNVELVNVDDLIIHPENPNNGDIPAIVQSIERNGWFGTITAQRSTRRVLAGNHRLIAARQARLDTVPVYWLDCDDATARRIMLADNRIAQLATYDVELLVAALTQAADDDGLTGTGWDHDDMADLLMSVTSISPDIDALADEWTGEQPNGNADDSRRTVMLNLEVSLADKFEAYINMIGDHDAAIHSFLEGTRS